MFQKIIAYLEKLGYTVEEQGRLEKYLVVFKSNRPVGFIMADFSVRLVPDSDDNGNIQQIIGFVQKNEDLQIIGGSEFLLIGFRGNQLTTYFDEKAMSVKYASYIHGGNGEVQTAIYSSYDTAVFRFITQTQMIDIKKYLAPKMTFKERVRKRLIRFLQEGQQ